MSRIHILRDIAELGLDPKKEYRKEDNNGRGRLKVNAPVHLEQKHETKPALVHLEQKHLEVPVEVIEVPVETSAEVPVEAVIETPVEALVEAVTEVVVETPVEVVVEAEAIKPVEKHTEVNKKKSKKEKV